ncbi:MAG: FISUMP domain-containing protein [Bacteroidales bacterium]
MSNSGENVVNETINANLISGTVVSNYGMIEIDSEIGGTLFVDDVIAGNIDANSFGNQLPNQKAGKHQVKIEGAETWIGEIEVYQNSTSKISIKSSLKPLSFDKPGFFTDKRDGKIYKTVQIGQQLWMEENLNYKTDKGSFCYDESEENAYKFGRLYNLEAAKQACPAGWRLPDKNDFDQLFSYFGKNDSSVYKSVVVSGSSGFKALLGGMREMSGASIKQNYQGYFWSSEVSENGNPWFFLVNKTTQTAYITYDNRYKYSAIMGMTDDWALSVRCIKN